MRLQLGREGLDQLLLAELALFLLISRRSSILSESGCTHSHHLLGGLDRKTVGLDGGTSASGLSLLVLALNLYMLADEGDRIEACPMVVSS